MVLFLALRDPIVESLVALSAVVREFIDSPVGLWVDGPVGKCIDWPVGLLVNGQVGLRVDWPVDLHIDQLAES